MANGMMNMGGAGSPMMQNVNQFPPDGMQMDMSYQRNMPPGQPGMQGGGGQSGNHALQDYQMQLMLLEQQNKKRLMMARQEQHDTNPGSGGPMPGVGMQGSGLSPNGSRTGTSPNPGEMKRTPGMGGGLPGSPSAAEAMAGRSPGGMGFMGNMQNQDFNGGMFMGVKDQPMMGGGPGMRPPTSDMNSMRQQGGRGNNQFPGGQPMAQQASQGGQQGMGTPGQRNEMPPPQAPAGANGAQRTAGGSPNANAPPTPSQPNKPNPKAKKGAAKEDNKRQVRLEILVHLCKANVVNSDRPRRTHQQMPMHLTRTLLLRQLHPHQSRQIILARSTLATKASLACNRRTNINNNTKACKWVNKWISRILARAMPLVTLEILRILSSTWISVRSRTPMSWRTLTSTAF